MNRYWYAHFTGVLCALMVAYAGVAASQANPDPFSGMKWRQIGPFRGGRVVAVSGVPGDPATWYFGGKSLRDTALPPLKDQLQHAGVAALPVPSGD